MEPGIEWTMEPRNTYEKEPHVHLEHPEKSETAPSNAFYTLKEEARVVRRLDFWIVPVLMVTYGLQYWDKALMGQAVLFNFAKDLELIQVIGHSSTGVPITSSTRYSNAVMIFYVGYLVATYPMTLLTQRLPTAKVCSASIFVWAVIVMTTPACKNYPQLMVNRFFLGVAESCIAPTFTVYITFWWTRREQPLRHALWYGMSGTGALVTPLIAWGLGHIHGSFGSSTWKYMYLVAGGTTMAWSLVVLWVLPDDPYRAKWLDDRSRSIVIARMKDSDAGDVERRLKTQQIWEALKDFNCWSNVFIAGATSIPNAVFSSFSTPVIHGFGYSDFDSLLLLMPLGAAAMIGVYGSGWITRRFDGWRYRMLLLCCMPALTGSLMCWLLPRSHPAALYSGLVLMAFVIGANAVAVALVSSNVAGHTKKATVSGLTFVGYCLGNITGPYCFNSTPGPVFTGGFISCVVCVAAVAMVAIYGRWHLARENARRDREFGPVVEGREYVMHDQTDRENRNFRYAL